jgi:hypothetical protein
MAKDRAKARRMPAVLHPHLVGGDPDNPSAAVMQVWAGEAEKSALRGILTAQAKDDDALRALLDRLLEDPDTVRGCLQVARAQLSPNN